MAALSVTAPAHVLDALEGKQTFEYIKDTLGNHWMVVELADVLLSLADTPKFDTTQWGEEGLVWVNDDQLVLKFSKSRSRKTNNFKVESAFYLRGLGLMLANTTFNFPTFGFLTHQDGYDVLMSRNSGITVEEFFIDKIRSATPDELEQYKLHVVVQTLMALRAIHPKVHNDCSTNNVLAAAPLAGSYMYAYRLKPCEGSIEGLCDHNHYCQCPDVQGLYSKRFPLRTVLIDGAFSCHYNSTRDTILSKKDGKEVIELDILIGRQGKSSDEDLGVRIHSAISRTNKPILALIDIPMGLADVLSFLYCLSNLFKDDPRFHHLIGYAARTYQTGGYQDRPYWFTELVAHTIPLFACNDFGFFEGPRSSDVYTVMATTSVCSEVRRLIGRTRFLMEDILSV